MELRIGTRILLSMAAVIGSLLLLALYAIDGLMARAVDQDISQGLERSRHAVLRFEGFRDTLLADKARSLAGAPELGAALDAQVVDPAEATRAIEGLARAADVPLLVVLDQEGRRVGSAAQGKAQAFELRGRPGAAEVRRGQEIRVIWSLGGTVHRVATSPVVAGDELLGTLCLGYPLDDETAGELRTIIGHDVTLVHAGRAVAASWRDEALAAEVVADVPSTIERLAARRQCTLDLGDDEIVATALAVGGDLQVVISRPLSEVLAACAAPSAPSSAPPSASGCSASSSARACHVVRAVPSAS